MTQLKLRSYDLICTPRTRDHRRDLENRTSVTAGGKMTTAEMRVMLMWCWRSPADDDEDALVESFLPSFPPSFLSFRVATPHTFGLSVYAWPLAFAPRPLGSSPGFIPSSQSHFCPHFLLPAKTLQRKHPPPLEVGHPRLPCRTLPENCQHVCVWVSAVSTWGSAVKRGLFRAPSCSQERKTMKPRGFICPPAAVGKYSHLYPQMPLCSATMGVNLLKPADRL